MPVTPRRPPLLLRSGRRSAAGRAPRGSGGWLSRERTPAGLQRVQRRVEAGGVDLEGGPGARRPPGRAPPGAGSSPSGTDSRSAVIDVRVRWRSSASVPVSTHRPARMMLTRSHSRSTSARMWLESSTVVPVGSELLDAVAEDLLHQRVQPGRRLVEEQQLHVGRERRDQGDLLPVALGVGCGPSWSGRARSARAGRPRRPRRLHPAAGRAGRSPRRRSGSATGSRRPGRRRAAGAARGVAPRVPAEEPHLPASSRSRPSRTRIVVDLPAPFGPRKPCTSPCCTARSSPSSARHRPERLDQALDVDHCLSHPRPYDTFNMLLKPVDCEL